MSNPLEKMSDAQLAGQLGKRRARGRAPNRDAKPPAVDAQVGPVAGEVVQRVETSPTIEIPESAETFTSVSDRLPSGPLEPTTSTDPMAEAENANRLQQSLELLGAVQPPSPDLRALTAEAAAFRLLGIEPRDTIEQMMATQMIALHAATMDCARRAAAPGAYDETRRQELNLAQKSSRAFAQLVDTLDRRRRGGEQKMTVEHVHVHAGGQAIVGNVAGQPRPALNEKQEG